MKEGMRETNKDLLSIGQVPENVRAANQQRADQSNTEKDNILTAIEGFKALLIS